MLVVSFLAIAFIYELFVVVVVVVVVVSSVFTDHVSVRALPCFPGCVTQRILRFFVAWSSGWNLKRVINQVHEHRAHRFQPVKDKHDAKEEEESYEKFVHKITTPRVKFGTKIHRTLHHHAFSKHKSYAYQWQAFCARSERYDYRDVVSEEAETFLSAFHFKLEDGCKRFERDVKTGKAAKDWDAASANHPTLGLVAIVASWKATVEAVCGKPWLFEDEEEQE